jgi:osmoprotectant transport system permease protein
MPDIDWGRIAEQGPEIVRQLSEHVQLTFLAVFIGMLISFPLGIVAFRRRWTYVPITAVTGILYTIPSIALFAFLVPYTHLTFTTAEIGLVSYTLLILIRNIVSGLNGVSSDVTEAATGMGYSSRQLLWRVQLPLALPVIMAGIRLATVTTVGLVTVTALIGYGGLGSFILQGLRTFDSTLAFMGATLSLILAVLLDGLLVGAERLVTPWAGRTQARATG